MWLLHWSAWIRGGSALDASVNGRVLGFTVVISTLTGMLFGLAPAIRVGPLRLVPDVRGHVAHADTSRMRLGRLIIAMQVAVSLVLPVSAVLFVRTLRNLHLQD